MPPTTKEARRPGKGPRRGRSRSDSPTHVGTDESAPDAEQPTRGPGRPPEGPGGETRDQPILVRLSRSERAALRELAHDEGCSVAEVLRRSALTRAARRKLEGS